MGKTEWEPVLIDVGFSSSGFFFNSSGLQWDTEEGFGGWLGKFLFSCHCCEFDCRDVC